MEAFLSLLKSLCETINQYEKLVSDEEKQRCCDDWFLFLVKTKVELNKLKKDCSDNELYRILCESNVFKLYRDACNWHMHKVIGE